MLKSKPSRLQVCPIRIAFFLLAVVLFLIVMHLVSVFHGLDHSEGLMFYFLQKFNLDGENTLPAYFSSLLLLAAALLSGSIAYQYRGHKNAFYWTGISLIFVLLSVDEASSFHELLINPLRKHLGAAGIFYFAWIIPAAIFILILALAYARFLFRLPARYLRLLMGSAVVYIGGAIGIEALGGRYAELHNTYTDLNYMLIITVEEACEMLGLVLFIYALLSYKEEFQKKLKIVIASHQPPELLARAEYKNPNRNDKALRAKA